MDHTPGRILQTVFGYDTFRPMQREIIENVLRGRDTLVIMPTGGGKSLCYQIPALIFEGLTIVVTPLISLMKDQVEQLTELGVPAVFINSSLPIETYQRNLAQALTNQVKLLYISPEALLKPSRLAFLSSAQVDCLTIDEAHCISQWGHDFRPEYRQLVEAREQFPEAVCIALTATATPRVRADIRDCLGFQTSDEFVASFNRENLFLEVIPKKDATRQTVRFIKGFPKQSGIIYCFTRRQVDDLAAILQQEGFTVRPYHAGLADGERMRNQEAFIRDDVQIIVATIAFGMGINKPNVRFVLHYDLPKSVENYYQEIGRSGRDGLPAHCLLLYSYADRGNARYFINKIDNLQQRRIAGIHLDALIDYAEGDGCRRIPLMKHFGEGYTQENCGMCDNCRAGVRQLVDITIPAQMFLSCVKRTGERFGVSYIVDVLRGSKKKKVLGFGHQNLSTYGIGLDHPREQWMHIGRQLIRKGLLSRDERYASLKLTAQAYEFLRDGELLFGVLEDKTAATAHGLESTGERDELAYDRDLFAVLRAKRKEFADEAELPPFVIFHDRTLIEMASYAPRSLQNLANLYGVGAKKLEKYGQVFLQVIADYSDEQGLRERVKTRIHSSSVGSKTGQTRRHIQVGEMFNAGKSVDEIAEVFDIKGDTVLGHLYKYSLEGHELRAFDFTPLTSVSQEQGGRVLKAFEEFGAQYLRPVFDAMGGTVSYDDLKILRLHYLCNLEQ